MISVMVLMIMIQQLLMMLIVVMTESVCIESGNQD